MDNALIALQKYWNYSEFRSSQSHVLEEVFRGRNVIGLLPTGGGKSLCFQVPALLSGGLTLVVSPLIALMEDQVQSLRHRGISAERIHSGQGAERLDRILDNVVYGDIQLLYVSPERLLQEEFQMRIAKADIVLLAIDEAHCISQWGHDFRPSYLEIGKFRANIGSPQTIALTATATPQVVAEIKEYLNIEDASIVRESFVRENIAIHIPRTDNKVSNILSLLHKTKDKNIIYARNRRAVQMISSTLQSQGLSAAFYHAGLPYKLKKQRQEAFILGALDTVVATNAFGMGIDIATIRKVVHYDIPPSVEEYFQEIGRAGRDGQASAAYMLISNDDITYKSYTLATDFQDFDRLCRVYILIHILGGINVHEGKSIIRDLDYDEIEQRTKLSYQQVYAIIKAWQHLGVWELVSEDQPRVVVKIPLVPREARQLEYKIGKVYRLLSDLMRRHEDIFDSWTELNIREMALGYKVEPTYLLQKLKYLQDIGALAMHTSVSGDKLYFRKARIPKTELINYKKPYATLIKRHRERWQAMLGLIDTSACRMGYILEYFGESAPTPCGKCDNCINASAIRRQQQLIDNQRNNNES